MSKIVIPKLIFGEWQSCPICNGYGKVIADGYTSSVYSDCPVCNGTRLIQRPIVDKIFVEVATEGGDKDGKETTDPMA